MIWILDDIETKVWNWWENDAKDKDGRMEFSINRNILPGVNTFINFLNNSMLQTVISRIYQNTRLPQVTLSPKMAKN